MIHWVPGVTVDGAEKEVILQALKFYKGNKTMTSNALGISIRTIDHKLERYENERRESEALATRRLADQQSLLDRQRGIHRPLETRDETYGGVSVESAPASTAESDVSVSQRGEVQEVLSKKTAKRSAQGAR